MSDFTTHRLQREDSQSSDEKMDTGSESFKSQDTPNSILSDFEEKSMENVLRLQNPEVLRLAEPENNHITQLSESFVSKMSNLSIKSTSDNKSCYLEAKSTQGNTNTSTVGTKTTDNETTNIDDRPKQLNIQKSSNLVLATNHPLMGVHSPDYPDVVPKLIEDLSLSSIEDEKVYNLYSPETNTSKNNLYFSENFVTAESFEANSVDMPPDVARIEQRERRRIAARFVDTQKMVETSGPNPAVSCMAQLRPEEVIEGRRVTAHSTPNSQALEFGTGVAQWYASPTHMQGVPNFDLPIELSTNVSVNNGPESPDVLSSPTAERSLYEALVDASTGRVALRPRQESVSGGVTPQRRKIQLPPDDDNCSLDSVSVSMDSEDEPPEPEPVEPNETSERNERLEHDLDASDDETKKSKSTSTISSDRTEPIPEYSAAEERDDQRSWLTVVSGGTNHTCDMKVIEPFKRVLSHGGYDANGAALIVLRACFLPDTGRPDYRYVMDNLFLYLIWSLERLVTEEYVLIILHGRCTLPPPRYLHRCYLLVDRRLRKCLKHLYLVHPTFWIRSVVFLFKPFVSSKFFKKLTYVYSLEELSQLVPVDSNSIPDVVRQYESTRR